MWFWETNEHTGKQEHDRYWSGTGIESPCSGSALPCPATAGQRHRQRQRLNPQCPVESKPRGTARKAYHGSLVVVEEIAPSTGAARPETDAETRAKRLETPGKPKTQMVRLRSHWNPRSVLRSTRAEAGRTDIEPMGRRGEVGAGCLRAWAVLTKCCVASICVALGRVKEVAVLDAACCPNRLRSRLRSHLPTAICKRRCCA